MRATLLLLCLVLFRARALRHTFDYAHYRLVATGPAPDFNGTRGRRVFEAYERQRLVSITCNIDNDKWRDCDNATFVSLSLSLDSPRLYHLNYTIVDVKCDLFYGAPVRETCTLYFNVSIYPQTAHLNPIENSVAVAFTGIILIAALSAVFYLICGGCCFSAKEDPAGVSSARAQPAAKNE